MGSLATVKVLREKNPTEITKKLLKDISSKSQSARMGVFLARPAAINPPDNLNKLLEEIVRENTRKENVKENAKKNVKEAEKEPEKAPEKEPEKETVQKTVQKTVLETADTIIESSSWGKQFREYLQVAPDTGYPAILRLAI